MSGAAISAYADSRRKAAPSKFAQKRERIIDAASELINERGVKGLTFVDVALKVDLNTTSVTYYFKRKELLAQAAFQRALGDIDAIVEEAARAGAPQERVYAFTRLYLDFSRRSRGKESRPSASLSGIRAMEAPLRQELAARYVEIARKARDAFFPEPEVAASRAVRSARTHVLLETLYWAPAWLSTYSRDDFPRVCDRLGEVFTHGFAQPGAQWRPPILRDEPAPLNGDAGPEAFLRAATRLVNDLGYRGASVERIAADLNVTKGSFYHHLEAKDDLVLECFHRSYSRVSSAQRRAIGAYPDSWMALTACIAALLRIQLEGDYPLLRTSALQALPSTHRDEVVKRSNRMAQRFAGMLIDGISQGSVRAVDPIIASQCVMATLNSAYELRNWASAYPLERAVQLYASTLTHGLFAPERD
ncbi:MAG: TetR family transcriptional regulator [Alphaproteobacteria bacterium]|nr:TetR family transcriptional regulator [Alphaproteobacteria bacterium]